MIIFPSDLARAINRLSRGSRLPLLFLLRDRRHGIVTRDHLRERDQIIAAITYDHASGRPSWRVIDANTSAALIAAAVESGATQPDPDHFEGLDDTANDFAHVGDVPAFLCPRCRTWSERIAATWSNAHAADASAGPCWALCEGCFEALKSIGDPNAGPTF